MKISLVFLVTCASILLIPATSAIGDGAPLTPYARAAMRGIGVRKGASPHQRKGSATEAQYDEQYAILATYFAGAAYCQTSQQQAWSCGPCSSVPGFQVYQTFAYPSTATYGYIGYLRAENLIAVAFRGTTPSSSLQSILQDLKFFKTGAIWGIPGAEVHLGFFESYSSAQNLVRSSVADLLSQNPSARVAVFGHSLGAAMATLCTLDLAMNITNMATAPTVTFGQPRVGNQAFANYYDQVVTSGTGHFRVVHYRDIVPHLPLKAMGFYHVADETFYPQEDMTPGSAPYHTCPSGESPNCSDGLRLDTSVHDHLYYFNYAISGSC